MLNSALRGRPALRTTPPRGARLLADGDLSRDRPGWRFLRDRTRKRRLRLRISTAMAITTRRLGMIALPIIVPLLTRSIQHVKRAVENHTKSI